MCILKNINNNTTSLMHALQYVTDIGLYELMTLACEHEGVRKVLCAEKYHHTLASFLEWFTTGRGRCDVQRNPRSTISGAVHFPWNTVTEECLQALLKNDPHPAMTG